MIREEQRHRGLETMSSGGADLVLNGRQLETADRVSEVVAKKGWKIILSSLLMHQTSLSLTNIPCLHTGSHDSRSLTHTGIDIQTHAVFSLNVILIVRQTIRLCLSSLTQSALFSHLSPVKCSSNDFCLIKRQSHEQEEDRDGSTRNSAK